MRRVVLIAIAAGMPLLWVLAPYGRMPPGFAMDEPGVAKTFAGTLVEFAREVVEDRPHLQLDLESAMLLTVFPALAAPLYPSVLALRVLLTPRRMIARRRWAWLLEGALILALSPLSVFWAAFALVIPIPGASSPQLEPNLGLLPSLAALAALTAIVIGAAPRSRFSQFTLGT